MKRFIVLLFLILLLFFSAKTTLAFVYTIEPSLTLSETYNDNIFLSSGDRVDDFITFITPGINLSMKSATSELRIGYSPSFSYYRSNNELNEPAHRFDASGDFTLSKRLSITLSDNYVKSSEINDIRDIPDIGPIFRRAELTFHSISGNTSYRLRENLSYTLGISYSDSDFNEQGLPEVKTYSGTMGLSNRLSEKTTLSADARYTKYDYRPFSDATGQSYTLRVKYILTPTLTIGLTGGATITKIEDTGESSTIFDGDAKITKIFERGEAALSCRQTIIPGIESRSPLREQTVTLSLSRTLTSRLTAFISESYSNFKSIKNAFLHTDETLFEAELAYKFRPWANLTLSYTYTDFDDRINDTGYYSNIVFLNLRLSYSRRL